MNRIKHTMALLVSPNESMHDADFHTEVIELVGVLNIIHTLKIIK